MKLVNKDEVLFQRPECLNEKQVGKEEYNKGWNDAIVCYNKIIKNLPITFDLDKFLDGVNQLAMDCVCTSDNVEEGDKA